MQKTRQKKLLKTLYKKENQKIKFVQLKIIKLSRTEYES